MNPKILKLLIPYIFIGSFQFQFAKEGLDYSSPYVFMGIRYLIAAAILLLISRKLIFNRNILPVALSFSASSLFWILGLEFVTPGDSAVLNYTMPLFAILGAALLLGEKPLRTELTGVLIGFVGIGIYAAPLYQGSLLAGAILSLVGAMTWGAYTVYLKKLREEDSVAVVGTAFLIGSIPFLIGAIPFHSVQFTEGFIIDLAYVSIPGGAILLFLWNMMIKMERIGRVTTMVFAVPATTVGIQAIQTMSIPNGASILGSIILFVGIFVSYMKR